jgi:ribosomal protein L33
MVTERITIKCENCGKELYITKSNEKKLTNMLICPYCNRNAFKKAEK